MKLPEIKRRTSRLVDVGGVGIGGGCDISVQSMTNTRTADIDATLKQINQLADAGADIVRLAAATASDTAALKTIVRASPVPIVADVHFRHDRALDAIEAGVAKIRLNPGNITDRDKVREVITAASGAGVAIRVGVNEGSIVDRAEGANRQAELSIELSELMADKLSQYLIPFIEMGFENLVLSAKSHDAVTCIAVNRLLAERWGYPLHLGLTHAGTASTGAIRSAAALGALLSEGIGDTIRISYAGDPLAEVAAALELLQSLRLRERQGLELIACPTCGRVEMDLGSAAEEISRQLADLTSHVTVAVMGCVVNGPGEAQGSDIAICAAKDCGVLFISGKKVRTVPVDKIVDEVVAEARKFANLQSR